MEVIAKELMVYRIGDQPDNDGVCFAEVLRLDDDRHVVILAELDDNPGFSVSQAWEIVVRRVMHFYNVPLENTVWIEHNPDNTGDSSLAHLGTYQLVTFQRRPGDSKPNWRKMEERDWRELGLEPRH